MSLFSFWRDVNNTRAEEEPTQPPQGSGVLPPPRPAGDVATVDTALSLSSVYRSVSIWATAVQQLTLDVWRGNDPVATPNVVRKPDVTMSLSAFLQQTVTSLACHGNAYWRVHRKDGLRTGEVRTIEVLDPMECEPLEDGTLGWARRNKPLQPWEFSHLSLLRMPGRLKGLGPIQAARQELQGALDLRNYATEWFNSGDIPPGVLTSDQMLNSEMSKAYKAQWYDDRDGIKVLGSGLSFEPLILSPEDAQFIASQNFTVQQIARMFGIPSHLLLAPVEGTNQTYSNMQQADLSFIRWTLALPLREIEEAFTDLLPRGQTARFNLDAVLRADTANRYEAHKIAIEAGFLSVNEVRAIEGLSPLAIEPRKDSANDE